MKAGESKKKILVIEDNEMNMKLFYDILTYHGFEVEKAYDGKEGYDKIKGGLYDLILLDIQLPKMNGFEILERLKAQGVETCPVVVVSAFASDKDKMRVQSYGVREYVTKPIDIAGFVDMVRRVLSC